MVEADVVERCRRCEACDVAAEFRADFIRANDHRERVPAYEVAQARLPVLGRPEMAAADPTGIVLMYGRRQPKRNVRAGRLRLVDEMCDELAGALVPLDGEHAAHRIEPLLRLLRVGVLRQVDHRLAGHSAAATQSLTTGPVQMGGWLPPNSIQTFMPPDPVSP